MGQCLKYKSEVEYLVSIMQVLGALVAILIASGGTDAEEADERAVIQGFHCDYIILSDVPSLSGCNDGFKFVIRKSRRVRSQYLILGGKTVLAFLKLGQKFSGCRSFNNITPRVSCKGPVGGLKPNFTPGNWTGGDDSGQICAQVICCGSDGVTYPTPCATPAGVSCVDYNECNAAPQPPIGGGLSTPPPISFRSRPTVYREEVGETAVLLCKVNNLGDSIIVWKQKDRIISAGMGLIRKDKRMALLSHREGV